MIPCTYNSRIGKLNRSDIKQSTGRWGVEVDRKKGERFWATGCVCCIMRMISQVNVNVKMHQIVRINCVQLIAGQLHPHISR